MRNLSSGYEPRWDIDAADGHQGELFAQWALKAITTGASVEIKTDRESWSTGNLYIERRCWKSGQWVPSGIDGFHTKSLLWAHLVAGPQVLFAPTKFVRYVADEYGKPRECKGGGNPTKGVILPIGRFVELIAQVGKAWAADPGRAQLGEQAPRTSPFGCWPDGRPLAPYGLNKDGSVRLQPGGRRSGGHAAPSLWDEGGAA